MDRSERLERFRVTSIKLQARTRTRGSRRKDGNNGGRRGKEGGKPTRKSGVCGKIEMVGETARFGRLRSPARLLAGANRTRLLRTRQVSAARRQRDATEPLFSSFNSPTEPVDTRRRGDEETRRPARRILSARAALPRIPRREARPHLGLSNARCQGDRRDAGR